jgi:hypothetical protein
MKILIALAILLLALVVGTVYVSAEAKPAARQARSPATTLPVQDSELPEILVNSEDDRTGLKMTVKVAGSLKAGKECEIRVEIENNSSRVEVVYMPALTMWLQFNPANKQNLRPDEFGPPPGLFGRMKSKDERLNYVVLMGGDIYGRSYKWNPPAVGDVKFVAQYKNPNDGSAIGVKSWRGQLGAESLLLKITP